MSLLMSNNLQNNQNQRSSRSLPQRASPEKVKKTIQPKNKGKGKSKGVNSPLVVVLLHLRRLLQPLNFLVRLLRLDHWVW